MSQDLFKENMRIVQELVPGRQITLAHIIANPDRELYRKMGLDPAVDYAHAAIGILTVSPAESAVIAADLSMKSSDASLGFVDRFTGTVLLTGSVSAVESSFSAVTEYFRATLGYAVCPMTRT